jgi:hypothetical protein
MSQATNDAVDRIVKEAAETSGVIDSAVVVLKDVAQLIRDNVNNAAKLTAAADSLDAKAAELAAAIATEPTPPRA